MEPEYINLISLFNEEKVEYKQEEYAEEFGKVEVRTEVLFFRK